MITQKECYENSINHGWWDGPIREFGELIGLVHSEISEVLEECRKGKNLNEIYYGSGKPCGIPIELADIAIRMMDLAEYYGFNIDEDIYHSSKNYFIFSDNFNVVLISLHSVLPPILPYGTDFYDWQEDNTDNLKSTAYHLNQICKKFAIDLEKAIEIKHAYNITRPYKHGGKKF